jgi:hypothetical protein
MSPDNDRAKISVSLPDDLKQQLDDYAAAHQLTNSDVVQKALRLLFQSEAPQPTPSPPPPPKAVDHDARAYLEQLAVQVEMMRRSMQPVMPVPYPLPPPSWYQPKSAKASWPPLTGVKKKRKKTPPESNS